MSRLQRLYHRRTRSFLSSAFRFCLALCIFVVFIGQLTDNERTVISPQDVHWPHVPLYVPLIPKRIIQTSRSASHFDRSQNTFTRLNPHYQYLPYNDSSAEQLVRETMPRSISETYMSLPNAILKADYFRYIALLVHGGIYSDVDTTCLRAIDTWLDGEWMQRTGLIVGIEADASLWDVWQGDYARTIQLVQWTIVAAAGHPILYEIVQRIAQLTPTMSRQALTNKLILEWTGPAIWTDVVRDYVQIKYGFSWNRLKDLEHPIRVADDLLILPITAFSPGIKRKGSKPPTDPEARVQHWFAGSWRI